MFQIENDADRMIVQEELAAWQAERRRLMLRLDVQIDLKERIGRCNEEAVARFTAGLEECAHAIQYFEAILAASPTDAPPKSRANGVHA